MTMLKAVSAIQTSDGALFSEAEYGKAVQHEKMVLAGIDYENIIAQGYLSEYLDNDKFDNTIDFIQHAGTVHFATALLVAFSDYRRAMNEEPQFESDDYAALDIVELDAVLNVNFGLTESAEDPEFKYPNEPVELVKAKKASKPKKNAKQPKPEENNEADPLYIEAVEMVRNGEIKPSGNALRIQFGIRHDRAKAMMDCMEHDGVVSTPVKGVRTVLR